MTSIRILSGAGAYADPWHPFDETSAEIARALAPLGDIDVTAAVDESLTGLSSDRPDLLVFNIGNAGPGTPPAAARRALIGAAADGLPLLAVHSSATAFPDWNDWSTLIGGRWVRGTTFHPPASQCTITLGEGADAARFTTFDERYTELALEPDAVPIATHEHEDREHPLAWRLDRDLGRSAYVGLGHDARAYASPGAVELLRATAAWLLDGARAQVGSPIMGA